MTEIFLDTETTGLSFKENHRIVEIACIETKDLIPTKNFFHKLINPQRSVPEDAFKIHGFSTEFLSSKVTFDTIADDLLNFIEGKKIIIHNAPFDLGFLNNELKLSKKKEIKSNQIIDTLDLARSKYPGSSNSLDALCKRFNIDLSRRTKHNAILDCELLREVYINLLDVKEPKLNMSSSNTEKNVTQSKNYNKTILSINESEIKKHADFLKKEIKKNYY